MKLKTRHSLEDVAHQCGFEVDVIVRFVSSEWIVPIDPLNGVFDDEDLARARLIWELQRDFGVNDEAVPVILHLLDQLNRAILVGSSDGDGA